MKIIHLITKKLDFLNISYKGSRFRRNFVKVAKANLIAQALPLLATPILTRLYSPEDFGTVVLLFTLLSFLLTFSTWRVEWSLPNAKNKREETILLLIGCSFLTISSALIWIAVQTQITNLLIGTKLETLIPYSFFIIIALLGLGMSQLLTGINIRHADMTPVSTATIARTSTTVLSSILLGLNNLTNYGLVVGNISGTWAETVTLIWRTSISSVSIKSIEIKEALCTWKKYYQECSVSVLVGIVNYGFIMLLPLSLATIYSVKEVGYYAVANKIAIAPVSLISKAVSQSFWAESSQLAREEPRQIRKIYKKTLLKLSLSSILPILVCLLGSKYIGTIFGQTNWSDAGIVLSAMTPQVVGTLIFGSTNHLTVYGKQKYQLFSDATTIIACIAWIKLVIVWSLSFATTIFGISTITLLGYILRFSFHLKANKEFVNEVESF